MQANSTAGQRISGSSRKTSAIPQSRPPRSISILTLMNERGSTRSFSPFRRGIILLLPIRRTKRSRERNAPWEISSSRRNPSFECFQLYRVGRKECYGVLWSHYKAHDLLLTLNGIRSSNFVAILKICPQILLLSRSLQSFTSGV